MADAMRSRPMVANRTAVRRMAARLMEAQRVAFMSTRMLLHQLQPYKVALQLTPMLFPPSRCECEADKSRFTTKFASSFRRFAQTPSNFGRGLFFAPNAS